ncbi:MAG: hypothetical protein MUF50_00825 [Planctomycetes bacterium]|jgi:exopolyphosphatase/guanosine-5'-triphosphate,3'-diphosphate pyrophosphatase|nr:hypothetical protein [Planctomycetota bacterium]
MKAAIIDIGTQSIKYYIFNIEKHSRKILHFERFSAANLGGLDYISDEAMERGLIILKEIFLNNKKEEIEFVRILGTDVLRKSKNVIDFIEKVKNIFNVNVEIISQDDEAKYLFQGFTDLIPDNFSLAAVNIGGGSTEFVWGEKNKFSGFLKMPFGAKYLKQLFSDEVGKTNWEEMEQYLAEKIPVDENLHINNLFITGVLSFIDSIKEKLNLVYELSDIINHPFKISHLEYRHFVETLRQTPLSELKAIYKIDPDFCDHVAVGQSVYLAIAEKLGVRWIIPSNNDLADGAIKEENK